jgi:hypothetical protein
MTELAVEEHQRPTMMIFTLFHKTTVDKDDHNDAAMGQKDSCAHSVVSPTGGGLTRFRIWIFWFYGHLAAGPIRQMWRPDSQMSKKSVLYALPPHRGGHATYFNIISVSPYYTPSDPKLY